MKTTRLARRLGLDGNPLRRRSDKIAARAAALLLAVFLIGAPLLSVAAAGWAGRAAAAMQRAERSWRLVPAILLQAAPVPVAAGGILAYPRVPARWTAPDGQARTGRIPVSTRLAAGHRSRCGWTRPARQLALRWPAVRSWPARSPRWSLPLSRSGLCWCTWRRPGDGYLTGAGSQSGKRHGPLSAPSGPSASGHEASHGGQAGPRASCRVRR